MTYYPDGATYTFLPDSIPRGVQARTVGWLDPAHPFPSGESTPDLAPALAELARDHPSARTRGYHQCAFCAAHGVNDYPSRVTCGDDVVLLGSAEIRVVANDGAWLIAPDLIAHYVAEHGYAPPREFVSAVLERRLAG